MKIKTFFLTLTILSAAIFPANAYPKTYTGNKGQYTVDYQAGTYNGCLFKQDCILLGPKQRVGPNSWQNDVYTYSVNDSGVVVYKRNKVIFRDTFDR